ncbi:GntR family transcriptional regulator [Acrocarpospora pleiomorpha]|uniref:GntR family transcriptional regulator n=1 Tax=Acrocarpospora pleiomorpha TaxID=90975 RepID=A0A5M3XF01_9ACTN|nr:GntR family transcriptional regulator [Acrocarpospora pleiomorpha]GES19322.1 GntR family transcriptional regulator [Acrocarpospora pleiomorpha]
MQVVRASSLVDEIRNRLRLAILARELPAGEAVRDSVLAAQMQVSRAPVREALRALEQSGLVVKSPNKSYIVASFTPQDLADLAGVRLALEGLACRLSVSSAASSSGMESALSRLREAVNDQDSVAMVAADRQFHEALVAASGNGRLVANYAQICDQIELALHSNGALERGREGLVERHEELLAEYQRAVERRDLSQLLPLLESHIAGGLGMSFPSVAGYPS